MQNKQKKKNETADGKRQAIKLTRSIRRDPLAKS